MTNTQAVTMLVALYEDGKISAETLTGCVDRLFEATITR